MENGPYRISPAEVKLVVYETKSRHRSLNIGIVKKTLRAFNLVVSFKELKRKWIEELNGSVKKLVFLVSSDTYLSEIKKKIAPYREQNSNTAPGNDIKVLVVMESPADDDNDVDDDYDFGFDYKEAEDEDNNTIKVNTLTDVYKWWPFVLQFLRPNSVNTIEPTFKQSCYFLFDENSVAEADWFKNHRDTMEKLGIRCLRREVNSRIPDDVYMKSSNCVLIYVSNTSNMIIDELKDKVQRAVDSGCRVRLFLENTNNEFAETVRDECQMNLSGTTTHAHWAGLMKDLDISKYMK